MTLYEIEIEGHPASTNEFFHSSTIVEGEWAPAGEAPTAVHLYANLLRSIAGGDCTYRIGDHSPTKVMPGFTYHARTIWLTEELTAVPNDLKVTA